MGCENDACDLYFVGPSGEPTLVRDDVEISTQAVTMPYILSKTNYAYDISVVPMVRDYTYGDSKEQALKVLEEAAEVVTAWKERCGETDWMELAEECADTIQAIVNLLYSCEIPPLAFRVAMESMHKKNISRGRKYLGDA